MPIWTIRFKPDLAALTDLSPVVIQLLETLIFTAIDLALSVRSFGSRHGYANQVASIVVR